MERFKEIKRKKGGSNRMGEEKRGQTEEVLDRRHLASIPSSHSVGNRGTNCLLTAVHASISIVPGDNNCVCMCVPASIHSQKWQTSAMRWQTNNMEQQYKMYTCNCLSVGVSDYCAKCQLGKHHGANNTSSLDYNFREVLQWKTGFLNFTCSC